jgi:hydrogenase maturation protease
MAERMLILGVGNLLLKDEGVGVQVARELKRRALPPEVEVCDGGVGGIGLLDYFRGASKLLLIDAAEMSLKPGAVVRFTPQKLKDSGHGVKFSTHDLGLAEVLKLAQALGLCPEEVEIIGIQPKEISWGEELSPAVQASLPRVVEMVMKEISSFIATEAAEAEENRSTSLKSENCRIKD